MVRWLLFAKTLTRELTSIAGVLSMLCRELSDATIRIYQQIGTFAFSCFGLYIDYEIADHVNPQLGHNDL
jgi:hypothetical protein